MYFSRFTQKSKKVIELSLECAREFGHNRVDSEHLLLGLSKEGDGVASRVLLKLGITPKYIEGKIIEKKGIIPITKANKIEHIKFIPFIITTYRNCITSNFYYFKFFKFHFLFILFCIK